MGPRGYRNRMGEASKNQELVERYLEGVASGDPEIAGLIAEDVRWLVPQSSPIGRLHEGKAAVLEMMAAGLGLYARDRPMEIEPEAIVAAGDQVFVEMTIKATTAQGASYKNHYVMVFRLRDRLIAEVHEHLDTLYAQRKLFDPAGQRSPLDRMADPSAD
ncbi:MAG: limonene-1,2-epoxide hydrolase [Deltaproteobacteria bacterium]|nr:limonene-1,2-epoxide hydrolase [Deltaproteobacteria bacterium]